MNFDYFYGRDSESFRFIRLPVVLMEDEYFKGLSIDAKVLYSMYLSRSALSYKNNWIDESRRVYIYFTVEDTTQQLACSMGTAVKLIKELEEIGLIEKKRQGQGKPTKIYVKNFISVFRNGPLFKLGPKLRLHSALAYKSSLGEEKLYIEETVEKVSDIFRHLDLEGDLLLVYDNIFNPNPEKEVKFIESTLVNLKSKEDYNYDWCDKDDEEIYHSSRTIYQVEGFIMKELFRQISLTDFSGDYDLASSIYIIDLKSKTIFYFYDDRGLYIIAREEKVLKDLWEMLPEYFFEDCHDFEIQIKKLYWIDGSDDNKEDLCLHGDLEIRLNDEIIKYSPTVSAAGLRLLRSLFDDHQEGKGNHLFPCCGNTMLANKEGNKVEIIGCDQGLDWSIKHKNGLVTIEADENLKTTYYYLQYKKEVLNFIKQIEDFYKKAGERILPEDEIDREGYLAFWKEWRDLKEKINL